MWQQEKGRKVIYDDGFDFRVNRCSEMTEALSLWLECASLQGDGLQVTFKRPDLGTSQHWGERTKSVCVYIRKEVPQGRMEEPGGVGGRMGWAK